MMTSTFSKLMLIWTGLVSFWIAGFYSPVYDFLQVSEKYATLSGTSTVSPADSPITLCADTMAERDPVTKSTRGSLAALTDAPQNNTTTVLIEVVPDFMKFSVDTFSVKAGHNIILELDNLDGMQHNLLIVKPNMLDKVGAAADKMLQDPKASEKQYVPDMPEVLFATKMLDPDEVVTLKFTAPKSPGYYPFVCTFPGHWRIMNGIMKVEAP